MDYHLRKLITELKIFFNNYIYTDKKYIDALFALLRSNTSIAIKEINIDYTASTHIVIVFEKEYEEFGLNVYNAFCLFFQQIFSSGELRRLIEDKYTGGFKNELLQIILYFCSESPILYSMYNLAIPNAYTLYIYL